MTQPVAGGADALAGWPCGLVSASPDGLIAEANDTFLDWTGYRREELVGRRRLRDLLTVGGRMLYETHLGPLLAMYGTVTEVALDLLRADGRPLPVLVNAHRPGAAGADPGAATRFVLVVVSERRAYERELLEARRLAEAAGAASERVQRRLSLIADVNLILSGTLDLDVALAGLATTLASERYGYCAILTYRDDPEQAVAVSASAHPDLPAAADLLAQVLRTAARPAAGTDVPPVLTELGRAMTGTSPQLLSRLVVDEPSGAAVHLGPTIVVPVRARNHTVATLLLSRPASAAPYTGDDLIEFAGLADRIGLFVDNLRLYAREHDRAIALQRALLTPPARPAGLDIVARYLPSADDAMVGGDWYDAFIRRDGATVLAIGDVTGHDHVAAAAMGQLRGLLRALAYTACQSPAQLLREVDLAAQGLGVGRFATAVVAVLHPADPGTGERPLTWASAGHLPPAVVAPDGSVRLLADKPDLMLGVYPGRPRHDRRQDWPAGSTLLLYTDGLVEDAVRSLDDGCDQLVGVLEELAGPAAGGAPSLDLLCDEVLHRMTGTHRSDDIALLAVRSAPNA